jgi:hypothetical protein
MASSPILFPSGCFYFRGGGGGIGGAVVGGHHHPADEHAIRLAAAELVRQHVSER